MSILTTIETEGRAALTSIQHAAAWLVGVAATTETSLHALEASSSIVADAIAAGEAAAVAHGVPIPAIEGVGEAVIAAAKDLAIGLAAPAVQVAAAK